MPNLLDLERLSNFVDEWWDKSALPSLCEFVEIPALSPSFDLDWESNVIESISFCPIFSIFLPSSFLNLFQLGRSSI